jgi:glycosyltransferase involved in cell wall biosynthesis
MLSDPLVSAVMPCRGRVDLTRQALDCYLAQTWRNKELVIVDDAERPAFPNGDPHVPGVFYWRERGHKPIGAKRNLANARTHGTIICHWDSDDYSAPGRIEDQVKRLLESGCVLTGYHSMIFIDQAARKAWRYHGDTYHALGSSLCYLKDFWAANPFAPDTRIGEDSALVRRARGKMISTHAGSLMFARNHSDNTETRQMIDRRRWEALAWPQTLQ